MQKVIFILLLFVSCTNKISLSPYPGEIKVFVSKDPTEAIKYLNKIKSDSFSLEDFENAEGITIGTESGEPIVIWLSSMDPGLISHEAFHATASIMKYAGIPLSDSSEEAYAYEQQYIVNSIIKLTKW